MNATPAKLPVLSSKRRPCCTLKIIHRQVGSTSLS
jgi:hypothetical protein